MSKGIRFILIGWAMLGLSTITYAKTGTELDICTRFMNTAHTWSTYSKEELKLASAIRRYVIDSSRAKGISDCKIKDELSEVREDGETYLKRDCDLLSLCS